MNIAEELLTAKELAAKLKTTRLHVLTMMHAGEIPAAINRPRFYRFDYAAVLAALQPKKAKSAKR
jgi:excisionase family DNA binding protein